MGQKNGQNGFKKFPEGVNRLRMANFSLFVFFTFSPIALNGTFGWIKNVQKSFLIYHDGLDDGNVTSNVEPREGAWLRVTNCSDVSLMITLMIRRMKMMTNGDLSTTISPAQR